MIFQSTLMNTTMSKTNTVHRVAQLLNDLALVSLTAASNLNPVS